MPTKKRKTTRSTRKKASAMPQVQEEKVVFAFRLTEAERDTIHKAAGPGGASRFVLGAAMAAVSGDKKAFDQLAAHAKDNLNS